MMKCKGPLFGLALALTAFLIFLSLPSPIWAETGAGRFFLMGDGQICIKNSHTGQLACASLLKPDGSLDEEGLARIDDVFGFPTEEMGEHISPRLLFMLDYFSDLVAPGKTINMTSGYRSPRYNSKLRNGGGNVAKTSIHMDGMALDFNIAGVKGKELWEIVRSRDCCGAGYYGGADIHLDAARPRFWEAATSKVKTGESDYNRRIYLSTDFDRYSAGDTVRLSLVSVSNFGFGIRDSVTIVGDSEGNHAAVTARVKSRDRNASGCITLGDRKKAHSIHTILPADLPKGKYRIKIDFCRKPFEQMPLSTLSNEIEVVGHAP
jgi:uncharacterized protein YcbK (DUF882 family)